MIARELAQHDHGLEEPFGTPFVELKSDIKKLASKIEGLQGHLATIGDTVKTCASVSYVEVLREDIRRHATSAAEVQGGCSLQLDRLRSELEHLRHANEVTAARLAQQQHEQMTSAVASCEAKARLELHEMRNWVQASIDTLHCKQSQDAEVVCKATQESVSAIRAEIADVQARLRAETRADIDHEIRKVTIQLELMTEQATRFEGALSNLEGKFGEKLEIAEQICQDALVKLRTHDLHAQVDSIKRLHTATGSIAKGLHFMAQVCGLLPREVRTEASLNKLEQSGVGIGSRSCSGAIHGRDFSIDDILDGEMSGNSLAHRMEDAWVHLTPAGKTPNTILDIIQQTCEETAWRLFRAEIGDLDAKVTRACQDFVAQDRGLKAARSTVTRHGVDDSVLASHRGPVQLPRDWHDKEKEKAEALGLPNFPIPQPTPRSLSARPGRVLTVSAGPPKEWSRASAALVPLAAPKMGLALADLRAWPDQRNGSAAGCP
mmetsp:Transcript_29924/g.78878  ORF Transcript_29924/g.78878 Transcript_29924/m.78878 type:complete len:491 (+) Transcript_29924:57-1529(+)